MPLDPDDDLLQAIRALRTERLGRAGGSGEAGGPDPAEAPTSRPAVAPLPGAADWRDAARHEDWDADDLEGEGWVAGGGDLGGGGDEPYDRHLLGRIEAAMADLHAGGPAAGGDDRSDAPPAALWASISRAVGGADVDAGGTAAPDVAPDAGSPEGGRLHAVPAAAPGAHGRRHRGRRRLVALAAAAVVVLLAAVAGVWRAGGDRTELVAEVALAPLEGSGAGHARLVRDGDRARLDLDEEQVAVPAGSYLEAWLIDPDSGLTRMVSLGRLDGSASLDVPEGIDVARYRLVDVSIEPADGVPTHSGHSVLRGTLAV